MAVSLGTRVSALLFVGAVAVATAAVTEGGAASRGGGNTNVSGGTAQGSGESVSGGAVGETPADSPSPWPSVLGSGGVEAGTSAGSGAPPSPDGSPTSAPSASTAPPVTGPAWLPPGPASPDTDHRPAPDSVYDLLRTPSRCRDALGLIPRTSVGDDWKVLRGLAHACLAAQGRDGGGWAAAERDHAALAGPLNTCKGRAAQRVLAGLLAFHRSRPSATARLTDAPAAAPACAYAVTAVDVGGDGEARPGDSIRIELRGTYFDQAELLREGTVLVGGRQVDGPPRALSRSGDGLVLAAVVPDLGTGSGTTSAGVTVSVRYATTEAVKEDAFRVVGPEVSAPTQTPGASEGPGGTGGTGVGGNGSPGSPGALSGARPVGRLGGATHSDTGIGTATATATAAAEPGAAPAPRFPVRRR
ncbi:hypothetical protein [Streptomyces sp. NPDC096132]|uniref:hypothetical protein n=1 Tax=Streptomyces sp. NPDC096132 TaxID=3366075 RepID=UPI0037F4BC2F